MKLDTRLRAGEAITDREKFLLGVIRYLDDCDSWFLSQDPDSARTLAEDFAFHRFDEEE